VPAAQRIPLCFAALHLLLDLSFLRVRGSNEESACENSHHGLHLFSPSAGLSRLLLLHPPAPNADIDPALPGI
jgi:hypothetical protein